MIEGETDAEVIFNGVGTVWNGIKLCPDKELALACYKVYNDWMAEFQAYDPERLVCNATLPTTGIDDCIEELHRSPEMGLRTVQLEGYPSGRLRPAVPGGRPVLGRGCRVRHADQRPPAVLLPGRRPRLEGDRRGVAGP